MRSRIAETVRRKRVQREAAMSVADRVALALELGARDVRAYAAAHAVSEREAARRLAENRAKGRRESKCTKR